MSVILCNLNITLQTVGERITFLFNLGTLTYFFDKHLEQQVEKSIRKSAKGNYSHTAMTNVSSCMCQKVVWKSDYHCNLLACFPIFTVYEVPRCITYRKTIK